ncbi:MAG TPA: HAD family hydrolase [Patescibacteria group bacterium]|nr:HAD family hydrolase [Patescibacteria group bacterium]
MQKILLLDFDNTLFDTRSFINEIIKQLFNSLRIPQELINKVKDEYVKRLEKSTDFDPEVFLHLLSKENNISFQLLKKVFYESNKCYVDAVYKDVFPFLNSLESDIILGIYSEGVIPWQQLKLRNCGLVDFFNPKYIFIARRKTAPNFLEKLPEGCTVVDDKIEVIAALGKVGNITPVWMNRKTRENFEGIRTIHTLEEIFNS